MRDVPRGMRSDWYSYSGCRTSFGGVKMLLLWDASEQAYGLPPTAGPGIFGRPDPHLTDWTSVPLLLWSAYPGRAG